MPLLVMLLAFLLRGQPIKSAAGMIYETESSYNYIQVIERGGCRYLLLNEGQGIHSVYCEDQIDTSGPWDYFLIAPYFNPPPHAPDDVERIALVGLAAGTITRQFDAVYGPIPMLGIEIDPKIVDVGRRYFAMDEPSLDVVVADGRYALKRSDQRFDLVGVDAYRLPYIPPHLTTVEFFQEVRDRLTSDGVLVINVGHTLDDYRLVEAMKATLLRVFPSVYVINVPESYNAIVVATVVPSRAGNLEENLQYVARNEFLYRTSLSALDNLRPTEVGPVVFTDDRAAIELMTNALLVDFFFARAID
jgi:spermidine synthase